MHDMLLVVSPSHSLQQHLLNAGAFSIALHSRDPRAAFKIHHGIYIIYYHPFKLLRFFSFVAKIAVMSQRYPTAVLEYDVDVTNDLICIKYLAERDFRGEIRVRIGDIDFPLLVSMI